MDELIYIKVIEFVDLQTALQLRLVSKFWLSLLPIKFIWFRYRSIKYGYILKKIIRRCINNGTYMLYLSDNDLYSFRIHWSIENTLNIQYSEYFITVLYGDNLKKLLRQLYGLKHDFVFPIPLNYTNKLSIRASTKQHYFTYTIENMLYVNVNYITNIDTLLTFMSMKALIDIMENLDDSTCSRDWRNCYVGIARVLKTRKKPKRAIKRMIKFGSIKFDHLLAVIYLHLSTDLIKKLKTATNIPSYMTLTKKIGNSWNC